MTARYWKLRAFIPDAFVPVISCDWLFTEKGGEGDDSDRKREMDDQENRPPTTIKEDLFLEGEELPVRTYTADSPLFSVILRDTFSSHIFRAAVYYYVMI